MIKLRKIILIVLQILLIFYLSSTVHAFTIVLDPGHGASDPGAVNGKIVESEITHKIGNYLKEYLEKYKDVKVIMTNNGSDEVMLFERAMIARNNNANILISLHMNSSFDSSANGAEVYVTANKTCDKYNKNCTELANMILSNLGKLGIANRGVIANKFCSDSTDVYSDGTRADWMGIIRYAMRGTMIDYGTVSIIKDGKKIEVPASTSAIVEKGEGIPSILVEHCFIKGVDVKFLDTDEKIKKLAEADGKAIVDYYGLELKQITTPTPSPTATPKPTPTQTPTTNSDGIKLDEKNKTITIIPTKTIEEIKKKLGTKEVSILDINGRETETIATGVTIKTEDKTYTIIKMGDVTGDGKVNSKDAITILRYYVDLEKIEGNYLKASDVTNDEKTNSKDAIKILRYFVDLETIDLDSAK